MLNRIDINADLGEGSPYDAQLMPLISSCSIACGGHFGNETTMGTAVQLAKEHKVKIGVHPSFPDIENFGRKVLPMTKNELSESVFQQLIRFYAVCESEDVPVHHIKLHGALYNYAAIDAPTADAVLEGILAAQIRPKLYVPYGSVLAKKAKNLLLLEYEAFIDRKYNDDLSLVPRIEKDAVICSSDGAWDQLRLMFENQLVKTKQLNNMSIKASTYCIHSDTSNVVEILSYIREQMKIHHIGLVE
ncbi:MAG: UPF0271 protein [Ulvibacter sp.]|jgi:UPF0271 protein